MVQCPQRLATSTSGRALAAVPVHSSPRPRTRTRQTCCTYAQQQGHSQPSTQQAQADSSASQHQLQRRTLLTGALALAATWQANLPAAAAEEDASQTSTSTSTSSNSTSSDSTSSGDNSSRNKNSSDDSSGTLKGSPAYEAATTCETTASGKAAINTSLSVERYLQMLSEARQKSWPVIAKLISGSEWIKLSQLLVQQPFDDVRQAAFYIPWALLQQDDYTAAVECRKAYKRLLDHIHDMATVALAAADAPGPSNALQVQQAFLLLNASLESFLSNVPERYVSAAAGKLY